MLEKKLKAGIFVKKTFNQEVSQENLIDNIVDWIFEYDMDIFLGPEWLFLPKNRLYSKSEKDDIIGELAEKTKSRDTLIIPGSMMWHDDKFFYNSSPVISSGQLIHTGYKHSDGGSGYIAEKRDCEKPMSREMIPCIFDWKGYRSGVEICSDLGLLNKTLKDNETLLDLYFFVSCGKSLDPSEIPVKSDGYALISDGHVPYSKVLQKEEEIFFNPIKPKKEFARMNIYELS